MKVFLKNVIIKKILIVFMTIIMVSNFIMPNYVHAKDETIEDGGDLFNPVTSLLVGFADRILAAMQEMFIGDSSLMNIATAGSIHAETPLGFKLYTIMYSPGIIFSGTVPAFDINFFDPMSEEERTIDYKELKETKLAEKISIDEIIANPASYGVVGTVQKQTTSFYENGVEGYYAIWEGPNR